MLVGDNVFFLFFLAFPWCFFRLDFSLSSEISLLMSLDSFYKHQNVLAETLSTLLSKSLII